MGGRPGPARRVELPIEQAADPIDEIVAEDAVEDAIEAATDSEVLLETDTDEASEPIEANPERTADE